MKTLIGIKKIFFETNNILSVFWNPTLFCNYRCSYCSYSKYSDKIDTASFDKYAKFIDRLFSECSRTGKKVLALSMSGGEPTMDPNLIPALNLIREYSLSKYPDIRVWFRINTNMSKPEAFISKFADIILQFDRANVTGSYHREYVNRDVFLHKMKILHDKGIMCDVNHVMTKQHFYEYYSDAKYFNDNGLNVMLSAERSHSAGKANTEYSDEEKQL
jgi:MoaA/NifB/PqqE/SkfB family radical SAM enzyme